MGLLSRVAMERSSHAIPLGGWIDASGDAVVPTEISWTLTDLSGNVINNRENVAIEIEEPGGEDPEDEEPEDEDPEPPQEVLIVLDSDDLIVFEHEQQYRHVTRIISATALYTNSLGEDLITRQEYRFRVRPLINVV